MSEVIRGHGAAIENSTHHRRDTALGEDACRVAHRGAASVLASFRDLAIGGHELEKHQERSADFSRSSGVPKGLLGPFGACHLDLWQFVIIGLSRVTV